MTGITTARIVATSINCFTDVPHLARCHQWRHLPPVVGEVDVDEPKVAAPGRCLVLEVVVLKLSDSRVTEIAWIVNEFTVRSWSNSTNDESFVARVRGEHSVIHLFVRYLNSVAFVKPPTSVAIFF